MKEIVHWLQGSFRRLMSWKLKTFILKYTGENIYTFPDSKVIDILAQKAGCSHFGMVLATSGLDSKAGMNYVYGFHNFIQI